MAGEEGPFPEGGYRRRRAWDRAKQAFGSEEVAEQLTRLERCQLGCPRVLLCACIDRFLRLDADRRRTAMTAYLASTAFPADELIPSGERSAEEARACEAEFQAVMRRVMAESGRSRGE